jgi:hypothetical protein
VSVNVKGSVWPACSPRPSCGSLLLDVVACLPRDDWGLVQARSFRSYGDSVPDSNALRTWDLATPEGTTGFGISPGDLTRLREVVAEACSIGGYLTVRTLGRWEPMADLDSATLTVDLSWPPPYPTWNVWKQTDPARSPLWIEFARRSYYLSAGRRSPNLDYVASVYRSLVEGEQSAHALGLLNCHLTSAVNSFAVWHRDIGAFAADLLWAVAQVATGTGLFYLDPRVPEGPMTVATLADAIRAGPEPWGGGPDELYWVRERDPVRYGAPRLDYGALRALVQRAEELMGAIPHVGRREILEAARRCTTCSFEEIRDGGLLWAGSELDDCVDEFYLRLAEAVVPGAV